MRTPIEGKSQAVTCPMQAWKSNLVYKRGPPSIPSLSKLKKNPNLLSTFLKPKMKFFAALFAFVASAVLANPTHQQQHQAEEITQQQGFVSAPGAVCNPLRV
jgi:hypothetical protein